MSVFDLFRSKTSKPFDPVEEAEAERAYAHAIIADGVDALNAASHHLEVAKTRAELNVQTAQDIILREQRKHDQANLLQRENDNLAAAVTDAFTTVVG